MVTWSYDHMTCDMTHTDLPVSGCLQTKGPPLSPYPVVMHLSGSSSPVTRNPSIDNTEYMRTHSTLESVTSTQHLVSDPAWHSVGLLTVLIGPQLRIVLLQYWAPDIPLGVDTAPA